MHDFAVTADAIAATASKLEKVRLLAAYLATLEGDRLPVATRWFAGTAFPMWDPRILQVGGAALWSALRELTALDDEALRRAWSRHGDAGDSAREALEAAGRTGAGGVDVLEVEAGFDRIASTRGTAARTALLRDLLARCDPLEARYVVKIVTGEMRIGLREGLVEEAVARAFDRDPAQVSRADMVVGDLGEVAVLARDDRLGEARPRLFAPMRYMLASPAADADEVVARMGDEVWVEDKYDGIRCQLHRDPERVRLYSRDLKDVTEQFPEVAEAAVSLSGELILDGELLAFRDGHVLPFQDLQTRLGRRAPGRAVLEAVPVVYVAWDLLYQDGVSLLDEPLQERRARLEAMALSGRFATSHREVAHDADALERLFLEARSRRNEGLMAKNPHSPYTPGRRGLAWLKLKKPLDTLDVVVVGAEWGHGKRRGVLSDVTFAVRDDDSGDLVTIGKAYTGLTDAEIAAMTAELQAITLRDLGHYRTVEPRIVLEIAFDRVQRSTRHRSGYALRFPRIVRRRDDKAVAEIDTLSRVRSIAESLLHDREQKVDQA